MAVSKGKSLLYGPDGSPIRSRGNSAYDASGAGRRARNWWPSTESINSITSYSGETLRSRSRDQIRRNPIALAAKDRYVSNIVGTGATLVSAAEDKALREAIHELWEESCDEIDADGLSDFAGQQGLVVGQSFEAGECFARVRPRRMSDGLAVPIQVQLLEPDFLRSTMNEDLGGGRRIRQGIEFDPIGRRVAYHFYREHPGERFSFSGLQTTRVPKSEVIQVFEVLRPGQLRGLPRLSTALAKLYEIGQYDDAQLVRQKLAALFAFFFTKTVDPSFGSEEDPNDERTLIDSIEPGTGYQLQPGESVTAPSTPSIGDYTDFMRGQLRQVAAAADLTYEQMTGDLKGVTYSSIRSGCLEIRRRHEIIQYGLLCFQFCRPVFNAWLDAAVLSGALEVPSDFIQRRRKYAKATWMPAGWQWVDPEKEVRALIMAIRAGLISRRMAVAITGWSVERIDQELAADNERADAAGLVLDSDPRKVSTSGVSQSLDPAKPAQPTQGEPDEDDGEEDDAEAA